MKKPKKNQDYTVLINRIKSIREEKNYTEKSMSEALGITQSAYNQKENGLIRFQVEDLFQITSHCKVCILDLFCDLVTKQGFADYAVKRGYLHGESQLKEIEMLRRRVNKLQTERMEMEKIIEKLEEDKKFLREMLKTLSDN